MYLFQNEKQQTFTSLLAIRQVGQRKLSEMLQQLAAIWSFFVVEQLILTQFGRHFKTSLYDLTCPPELPDMSIDLLTIVILLAGFATNWSVILLVLGIPLLGTDVEDAFTLGNVIQFESLSNGRTGKGSPTQASLSFALCHSMNQAVSYWSLDQFPNLVIFRDWGMAPCPLPLPTTTPVLCMF